MQKLLGETRRVRYTKNVLLALLCLFSLGSVVFSFYVLFGDLGAQQEVSPAQSRGLFTVFIYDNINTVHPQRPAKGTTWEIKNLEFENKNLAVVDTSDGQTSTKLEFIYTIEYPKVRVLKINDITGRDLQDANVTLVRFLTFLRAGDYANAAVLYGGPISRLVPYGSESSTLPKLLEAYCMKEASPTGCLPFQISGAKKDLETASYRFTVTYRLPDNKPFALADGTSQFTAIVDAADPMVFRITSLPFDR